MKPQERLATFPTVKNPTNLFSSEPFRKCLAKIYPLAWEKSRIIIDYGYWPLLYFFQGSPVPADSAEFLWCLSPIKI